MTPTNKQGWFSLFLCILLVNVAVFGFLYESQFVKFGVISGVIIIGGLLVFSVRKLEIFGIVMIVIGVLTVFMSSLISSELNLTEDKIKPHLFWWDQEPHKSFALSGFSSWGKIWSLATGIFCLALGMILGYMPTFLYVKNRLPFDYPYPIWKSSEQAQTKPYSNLVPLRRLLDAKERIIISKYKFVLVSIENKRYLVEKNEKVPKDSQIIRTQRGKFLCGL